MHTCYHAHMLPCADAWPSLCARMHVRRHDNTCPMRMTLSPALHACMAAFSDSEREHVEQRQCRQRIEQRQHRQRMEQRQCRQRMEQ
eukprot:8382-Chlamydomonas_euryale.AAC.1